MVRFTFVLTTGTIQAVELDDSASLQDAADAIGVDVCIDEVKLVYEDKYPDPEDLDCFRFGYCEH